MRSLCSTLLFAAVLVPGCKPQATTQASRKPERRNYLAIDQIPPFRVTNDSQATYSGDLIDKLPLSASERTTGALSFSDIGSAINSTTDLNASCEPESGLGPEQEGGGIIDFTIGKDGVVRDIRVLSVRSVAEAGEDCVVKVLEGVRFPVRNRETLATYPFLIRGKERAQQPASVSVNATRTAVPAPPVAGPPPDAKKQPDGLASKMLAGGTGTERPRTDDTVYVNYTCWSIDGHMVDHGQHARLLLNRIIPGWSEGIGLMNIGEKRRLWVPQNLAFHGSPPSGMLVFDVELLEIRKDSPK